jgi:hypothetical protein
MVQLMKMHVLPVLQVNLQKTFFFKPAWTNITFKVVNLLITIIT